jgi:arylsulfatase A-like enzyme
MKKISRRDFLRSAGALVLGSIVPGAVQQFLDQSYRQGDRLSPNVIVLVFDTMSAHNVSLYGYRRGTTPNLERFAERATVFHKHISAGNYTTPGTASLLTGTYPWTHRAINQGGLVLRHHKDHNIFSLFPPHYQRFAFTQNLWADYLIDEFGDSVDFHLLPGSFSVAEKTVGSFFPKDKSNSFRALDDFLFETSGGVGSLVFGPLEKETFLYQLSRVNTKGYSGELPHDVTNPKYFHLNDVFDGVSSQVTSLASPFFAYVHLYAPHEPYRPRMEFENIFHDNWRPVTKPASRFSDGSTRSNLNTRRRNYDEYIANVDAEFGRLFDSLNASGILDNTILVVTSDHGQLFERGVHGHSTPLLYDPVIHVPLLISLPGQTSRTDVQAVTSSVDVLPTLLQLAKLDVPEWCEGIGLPGMAGQEPVERAIYSVEAKSNSSFAPLKKATVAMHKNGYKLIYYHGYDAEDQFELYDILNDPEELSDLYPSNPSFIPKMRDELFSTLSRADQEIAR